MNETPTMTAEALFREARAAHQAGDTIAYRRLLQDAYAAKAAAGQPVTTRELETPWLLALSAFPAAFQGRNTPATMTDRPPTYQSDRLGAVTIPEE